MSTLRWRLLGALFYRISPMWSFVVPYLYTYITDKRLFGFYRMLGGNGAMGVRSQPWRGYHILRILRRQRPRRIVELGSGTSTGAFASYANGFEAQLTTYEQTARWHEATMTALMRAGLGSPKIRIELVASRESNAGCRFASEIDRDSDFVYVDGPVTVKVDGRKKPCLDVVDLLDRGGCPHVIMVDGRYDTVRAIKAHKQMEQYDVVLEHGLAYVERNLKDFVRFQRHTVFVRKA